MPATQLCLSPGSVANLARKRPRLFASACNGSRIRLADAV